jgi:ribosomal protein S18 acetylase RimI-like enzyme
VAEVDTDLAGYTMLVTCDPDDADVAAAVITRPTAELSKVYVHPAYHGAGIAAALVSATVDEAAVRGAASVWLGVNQENGRANRFYEKSGFALVGTKRFEVGDRYEDDFVRERILDAG